MRKFLLGIKYDPHESFINKYRNTKELRAGLSYWSPEKQIAVVMTKLEVDTILAYYDEFDWDHLKDRKYIVEEVK